MRRSMRFFTFGAFCALALVLGHSAPAIADGFASGYAAAIQAMKDKGVLGADGSYSGGGGGGGGVTSITGTANQVTASAGTGAVTLSLPQSIHTAATPTFASLTLSSGLTLTGATVTGAPTWGSSQAITLSTAAQPNVTSLGTLTALNMGGTLTLGANTLALATATVSGTPTWGSSQAITLSTAAQPNVTSLGTLTALAMGGTLTVGANTLSLASSTVAGTPTWSSSQAITLSTAAQPNITSVGTLTGLTMGGTLTLGANTLALASATISGTPTWSSSQAITLSTAAQTAITSVGTLSALTISGTLAQSSGQVHAWNSDAGISRISGSTLAIGNGTAGDVSGTLQTGNVTLGANGGLKWATGTNTWVFPNGDGGLSLRTHNNVTEFSTSATGKVDTYGAVATAGWGSPAIYGSGRSAAQTSSVASVAAYTVGAADGSFLVVPEVEITTHSSESFTVTVAYTDPASNARTTTFNFSDTAGTIATACAAAGVFQGIPLQIRCKAATAITVATTGTFTGATYSVEATIAQIK